MAYYEFKNHVDGIPNFVINGGSFYNPSDKTYVTYIPDDVPFWVPDTLTKLTKAQFEQRAKDINIITPFTMIDVKKGNIRRDMTEAEVVTWVLEFFSNYVEPNQLPLG
jgi:hypothetical protein